MARKILVIISIVRAVAERPGWTLGTHRLLRGNRFHGARHLLAAYHSARFDIIRRAVGCHRYIAIQVGAVHRRSNLGQATQCRCCWMAIGIPSTIFNDADDLRMYFWSGRLSWMTWRYRGARPWGCLPEDSLRYWQCSFQHPALASPMNRNETLP